MKQMKMMGDASFVSVIPEHFFYIISTGYMALLNLKKFLYAHSKIRTWVSAATMRHTYHYTKWAESSS